MILNSTKAFSCCIGLECQSFSSSVFVPHEDWRRKRLSYTACDRMQKYNIRLRMYYGREMQIIRDALHKSMWHFKFILFRCKTNIQFRRKNYWLAWMSPSLQFSHSFYSLFDISHRSKWRGRGRRTQTVTEESFIVVWIRYDKETDIQDRYMLYSYSMNRNLSACMTSLLFPSLSWQLFD
jgi:hypothetical protein